MSKSGRFGWFLLASSSLPCFDFGDPRGTVLSVLLCSVMWIWVTSLLHKFSCVSLFAIAVIISKISCWVSVAGNRTSAVKTCSSSASGCDVDFRSGRFSVAVSLFWHFSKLQLQLGEHVFPADLHGQTPRPFFLAHFDFQSQIILAMVEFVNPFGCVASDMASFRFASFRPHKFQKWFCVL